jgi:hypothetical protein
MANISGFHPDYAGSNPVTLTQYQCFCRIMAITSPL